MFNVFSVEISHQFEQMEIMQCCMHAVIMAVGAGDDSHQF
jgi:hypothetical protein